MQRLLEGNPGQHRVLTGGVVALKVDYGAGYRVYYTRRGSVWIILLCGGDKTTQSENIASALTLAANL